MSKFAAKKKGHLVVDVTEGKKPKLGVVGQEESKVSRKGIAGKPAAEKAEKPAKKAEKAERAPKEADTRKITLVNKENPKREGSAAYDRYELYRKAKTVAAFYEAGGTSADLRFDEKAGHIEVA